MKQSQPTESRLRFFLPRFVVASVLAAAIALAWNFNHRSADAAPMLHLIKGNSYDKEWKRVDSLQNKGLYKSALDLTNQIYARAKKENNSPQVVKALIHRYKFSGQFQENSADYAIYNLQDEIKAAQYPLKPVLQSMLGELYWEYYTRNRWKFYNRTQTVQFKNDSINTWDLNHLVDQAEKNFVASLAPMDSLQRTDANMYEDVIDPGTAPHKLRPTLFDFLAHRAVDFFSSEEPDITRPADHFVLDDPGYYSPMATFSTMNISTGDTMSMKFYAVRTLQQLVKFHLNDQSPDALVDVDLKRIKFIHSYSVADKSDSLYEVALRKLAANYPACDYTSEVMYEIAVYHSTLAESYKPGKNETNRWEYRRALEICNAVIKKYPGTLGAQKCEALRTGIVAKSITFTTESAISPDLDSRGLLTWKNTDKVYFRIVKTDESLKDRTYDKTEEEIIKGYLKLPVVTSWDISLPSDSDYQSHSAEIKIPSLPHGHYVLLASATKNFTIDTNWISYGLFWSSSINFVRRTMTDGSFQYVVMNRQTGEPLSGVTAQVWREVYDYSSRGYHFNRAETYTSDKDGMVNVNPPTSKTYDYRDIVVEFISGSDHFYSDYEYQYRNYREDRYMHPQTFFFTDRSIYRPGQTVYFKGIVINTDGEKSSIYANYSGTVTFYDFNYQKVSSIDVKTNAFGSFSGSFTAPDNGVTGQMHLQTDDGSGTTYFRVEEYKRPHFEVTTQPAKGAYRLNDTVKVSGVAKSFSGAAIDHAQVKFRVQRTARFPWWWWYWWGYYPSSPAVEITNGTMTSNDTGGFVVHFNALPDRSVPVASSPIFTYNVYIDVTDISGETHSTQTSVDVGYAALELSSDFPDLMEKNDNDSVSVTVNNLSGQPEPSDVSFSIHKLITPDHPLRDRWWDVPDKFIYTKADWNKWFPNDEYKDENDKTTWAKGAEVFQGTINTGKVKKLALTGKSKWAPGMYIVEAQTKDKYGVIVKDLRYFTLYSESDKTPPVPTTFSFRSIKADGQPGEKAKFMIGSSLTNAKVMYEIEFHDKITSRQWITLNNETKFIEIPIQEKDRGGFAVHFATGFDSRIVTSDQSVSVPLPDNSLDIKFETFRDKLLPGSQEEWKLKIKGPKGEKVAAEMLASMYDASLDQFAAHGWSFYVPQVYYGSVYWQDPGKNTITSNNYEENWNSSYPYFEDRSYDKLNWFGFTYGYGYGYYYGWYGNLGMRAARMEDDEADDITVSKSAAHAADKKAANFDYDGNGAPPPPPADMAQQTIATGATTADSFSANLPGVTRGGNWGGSAGKDKDFRSSPDLSQVQARSNLNETVFFFPNLETDSSGNVIIKFKMNEALTKWKFMAFAHTKDLQFAQVTKDVVTQKDLMVTPNAPRFFRENDTITFTAKVSNLSDHDLTGDAQLMLYDALSMKPIDTQLHNVNAKQSFTAKKGQSAPLSWDIIVPVGTGAVQYKIVAGAGNFSDGEENAVPVLSNRMLVTETMPLPIRGGQTKDFHFDKLLTMGNGSTTLSSHKLTLEFTSNPAWYAVQALPYLMEYPYECAEQTFDRFYANSIATDIANSSPKIKAVFDNWKSQSPDAFLSNLEKNQDLKSLVLSETPWVLDAKDESDRKRRVGLLFDLNRMANEQDRVLRKLEKMQLSNGGWPWFDDMPDDRYITQYIITGFGHLDHLGIKSIRNDNRQWNMVQRGVRYLDARIREDYEWILKWDPDHINDDHLSQIAIQYLYARSYFKDIPVSAGDKKAFDYFYGQAQKYWLGKGNYMEGMIALGLFRYGDRKTSDDIMKSLKETALTSDEMGMYWKDNSGGYYWYQAPIETEALLIEAFKDIRNDTVSVDNMRVWLLKNKQTNDWKTTKATAEACYALLIDGTGWLAVESDVQITVGKQVIDPKKMDVKVEAGTGYFKTSWSGSDITPDMGNVHVTKSGPGVSWGAMYWQYFEDLDKITVAQTPLSVEQKLFLVQNTPSGPVITPVTAQTVLKPGDKIRVRTVLRTDRDMEYIHMKDMRAAGFEPVNVLSQYKYQDGLGYYESTRDASTDFFFSYLPKGTHVFEYDLVASHPGQFSNGITTVQCMYAPEFSAHSAGIRVKVSK